MENKNKAEELAKKLGDKFAAYSILPKAEQRGFLIAYRLLEDEIDELTKEVERLRKEREWISVEDRLPIEKEEVLVKVGTQGMGGMKYRISIGHCNEQGRFNVGFDWSRVTHWQPLPPINH